MGGGGGSLFAAMGRGREDFGCITIEFTRSP